MSLVEVSYKANQSAIPNLFRTSANASDRGWDLHAASLASMFRFFGDWRVAAFDEQAAAMIDGLRKKKVNIGSSDLKIAAIALVNDAVVLTANSRDFEKVPSLRFENWLS